MQRAGYAGRAVVDLARSLRRSCALAGDCAQVKPEYGERVKPSRASHYASARRNTSVALVPPNPNEFDSATAISRRRALCGTRSIGVWTSGSSRLMVGGATWSRIARIEKIASTAPAAPSRWPMQDLVDDIEILPAALPTTRSTAASSIPSAMVEVPWALM